AYQANYLGTSRSNLQRALFRGRSKAIHRSLWVAIDEMFRDLDGKTGPSEQGRRHALAKGYHSAWAWDDDEHHIDDPDAKPLKWQRTTTLRRGTAEDAEWLMSEFGGMLSLDEVAERLEIERDSVEQALHRHRHGKAVSKATPEMLAEIRARYDGGES